MRNLSLSARGEYLMALRGAKTHIDMAIRAEEVSDARRALKRAQEQIGRADSRLAGMMVR